MVMPAYLAYVAITPLTCGKRVFDTRTVFFFLAWATIMRMASAAAVGPSYMEALLTSIPVRVQIMLWYSNM